MNGLSESEREDLGMEALASMGDGRTTPLLSDDFLAVVDRIADARVKAALEAAAIDVQAAKPFHTLRNYTPVDQAYDDAARIVRAAIPQSSRRPADHLPPER